MSSPRGQDMRNREDKGVKKQTKKHGFHFEMKRIGCGDWRCLSGVCEQVQSSGLEAEKGTPEVRGRGEFLEQGRV